ncbi:MAG: DUF6265 family protein [Acidobacteria bacterium]|nr:DUF6265 family protein [Acidobacteriota bacterium]
MRSMLLGLALVLASAPALAEGPPAKVADLAWMTGYYKGDFGAGGTLEENWSQPSGSSIAALIRISDADATTVIELIVIEEEGDSLTLRLKQWARGMNPLAEGFEVMELVEVGDQSVLFRNVGGGVIERLGYSLAGDAFTISLKTDQGELEVPLTRQGH